MLILSDQMPEPIWMCVCDSDCVADGELKDHNIIVWEVHNKDWWHDYNMKHHCSIRESVDEYMWGMGIKEGNVLIKVMP